MKKFNSYNFYKTLNFGKHTVFDIEIAVDASVVGGNPGSTSYRAMDVKTQKIIFSQHLGEATNNIGEWMAIVDAIKWLEVNNKKGLIYSDSKIALAWVVNNEFKSNMQRDYPDRYTEFLDRNINVRLEYMKTTSEYYLMWWDKYVKGENIADYGFKTTCELPTHARGDGMGFRD